jgi:glucose/arabinose dehydrogenase
MRKEHFQYLQIVFLPVLALFFQTIARSQPAIAYEPLISSGLSSPMEIVSAPGDATGRLFIVEKGGTIKIWNGSEVLATPFLDISTIITSNGERGLLSMAFHPDYASNGYFFVYYTNNAGAVTIARYIVSSDPDIAGPDPNPAAPLITIPKLYANHNGGHLQFRTEEGVHYLYFATGDGGGSNDPDNNAQNPASLPGKMIRMNVDATPVTIEQWAIGLRNPFRWSFDRLTGDIWIGDVGQGQKEEVNFREAGSSGANYGWPCYEGTIKNADADPPCDPPERVTPVFEYDNPDEGSSVVGGYVYRGDEFAALQGYYFVTDYYSGNVWIIQRDGNNFNIVNMQPALKTGISSISEVENGTLYAAALTENAVYKIIPLEATPLTLTHFSGRETDGGYNELNWTTATEQNVEKFVIEYSSNGTEFSSAGAVNASNNINGAEYSFRHYAITGGKIFYRLNIIDADGTGNYSPAISINNTSTTGIKIYPTIIAAGKLHINSGKRIDKVQLFTVAGKPVLTKETNGANGYFSIVLPALQKGMYIIQLTGRDFQKNQKIIIQ